ncbi:hypothetical protein JCM19046_3668 [Bacillus sp. JCM 19046]|nr:hypothetical protein JCM19045_1727 [Bacillus sp. JCM 19045]GAF19043.1 hypothetical protein JCM19046_3668 [Bacillus sp. JCM 19046]
MKKHWKQMLVAVLALGMFAACSDGDDEETTEDAEETTGVETNAEADNDGLEEGSGLVDRNTIDNNEADETDDSSPNLAEGSTEDQLDLTLGDTATIETTIELFEMTLDSVEVASEMDGEAPDLDVFVLADVTITNLADDPLDLEEAVEIFEITSNLEGGGYWPVSELYEVEVDTFIGELASGETASGQILFEGNEGDEHYIRVRSGLVAASAVKNQVTWTFDSVQ